MHNRPSSTAPLAPEPTRELRVEKVVFEGKGLARDGGYVVFIEGALPGERVRAEWLYRRRHFGEARLVEVLEPSPHRCAPPCPLSGTCGGCSFLHCGYAEQLQLKLGMLREALHAIPGAEAALRPPRGMETPFFYRNKMIFTFAGDARAPRLGLHRRHDFRGIVTTDVCRLQSPESNAIIARTLDFVRARGLSLFDGERQTGLARELMVREGKHTGERLVQLNVTARDAALEGWEDLYGDLCQTALIGLDTRVNGPPQPTQFEVRKGTGWITEQVNGLTFAIGPTTFFQTNSRQAGVLFQILADWAAEIRPRVALDIYSGIGPIALHLSRAAGEVWAVESNPASVDAARENAQRNGIANVHFACAEMEKAPAACFPAHPDLAVVDPPRPGLMPRALERLVALGAPHLFYVSCNPATLARDLVKLTAAGYAVETLQPVDMFPHTFHIETLARLRRS